MDFIVCLLSDLALEVDADLEVLELPPTLLACAKASDWKAVNANPMSATAIVVLIVFMIKKF